MEDAAVAGAVRRGRRATSSPMMSSLWGSRLWLVDFVSLSPAAVVVSRPPVPPASEPAVPRYLAPVGVRPPTDETTDETVR